MRMRLFLGALAMCGVASFASAQVLTCSTTASDQCNGVHFHVQFWNPETKGSSEIYGQNSFSTMEACEAVRKYEMTLNQAGMEHLARTAPRLKAQAARFGQCHCDMTGVKSDPHYLDDVQRVAQLRRERELKLMFLELLLDHDVPLDSDLARGHLSAPPARVRAPYWPREVAVPEVRGDRLIDPSKAQALQTTVVAGRNGTSAGSKLELAEVKVDAAGARSATSSSSESTAAPFIETEMAKMTLLLGTVMQSDSEESGSLLEAANERIQALTNLARLTETAGARSRLAAAMANAGSDQARMSTVKTLFGDAVARHWAPAKPADLLMSVPDNVANDPVTVLRDTTGRFSAEQKKLAFYIALARNATLTDSQELWLAGIANAQLGE